ncbi:hypothetical protein Tco_1302048 [Tanacetum coccineum]
MGLAVVMGNSEDCEGDRCDGDVLSEDDGETSEDLVVWLASGGMMTVASGVYGDSGVKKVEARGGECIVDSVDPGVDTNLFYGQKPDSEGNNPWYTELALEFCKK